MIKNFVKSECGAVTVDWVVLTAAIVFLGTTVGIVISQSATEASTTIQDHVATRLE